MERGTLNRPRYTIAMGGLYQRTLAECLWCGVQLEHVAPPKQYVRSGQPQRCSGGEDLADDQIG